MKQGQTTRLFHHTRKPLRFRLNLEMRKELHAPTTTWAIVPKKERRAKALEAYSEVEAIISSDESLLSAQIILGRALLDLGEVERARKHAFEVFERTDKADDLLLMQEHKHCLDDIMLK